MSMTISLCQLELDLIVDVAKQRYTSVSEEDSTFDLEAIDIGLDLGNRKIGLSATMREVLDSIRQLDAKVYDAFLYAYQGSFKAK